MALGPDVSSPVIGSRVGVSYAADACLTCGKFLPTTPDGPVFKLNTKRLRKDHCLVGGESSCKSSKISGYFTPGTFQQYCLASARYLIPIPDGLEPSEAAPLMCGGVTVYAGLKRAKATPGCWVAVCGAGGGLGHLGIQYAKAMGCRVVALDTKPKREFCLGLGADDFVDVGGYESPSDMDTEVKRITAGGARVALMCTSSSTAYSQAMSWLGFRGTLVCLGIPKEDNCLTPNITAMVTSELQIIGRSCFHLIETREKKKADA